MTNWTIVKTTLWYTDELVINFCKNLLNSDATLNTHLLDSGRSACMYLAYEPMFSVQTWMFDTEKNV